MSQAVQEWFTARGFEVLPSYGADSAFAAYVMDEDPDRAALRWVEVKAKAAPTLHRISNTLEHGINLSLFREFQALAQVTGAEVELVIYEQISGELLARTIGRDQDGRVWAGDNPKKGGMIFWPRDSFRKIGEVRHGQA